MSELDAARREISANVAKERVMTEQIDEQASEIETLIQENESTRDQLRKSKSREEYNELVEAWQELFPVIFSLYREGSHEKKEKRKAKEPNSRLRSELQQHQDQGYPVTVQIMSEEIDDLRKENAQLVDEKSDLAKTASGIFLRLMNANIVILKYSLVYKDPLTKDDFLLWTEQMTSLMEDLNLILSYISRPGYQTKSLRGRADAYPNGELGSSRNGEGHQVPRDGGGSTVVRFQGDLDFFLARRTQNFQLLASDDLTNFYILSTCEDSTKGIPWPGKEES